MRRVHHAPADVQRGAHDAIGVEPLERVDGPDDVDNRVERADFVQVYLVDRDLMDGRFGFSQTMEERLRAILACRRKRRALDKPVDLRQAAMGMMGMGDRRRRVLVGVRVRMSVIVTVFIVVMMDMIVVTAGVSGGAVFIDDELGGRDTGAKHAPGRDRGSVDGKAAQRAAQLFERQAGVEEGAQHHIARRAVETVEIENAGHDRLQPAS